MRPIKISDNQLINLDLVTDLEWVNPPNDLPKTLIVTLATPMYDSVGASDWVSTARQIRLKGEEAARLWIYLTSEAEDTKQSNPATSGYDYPDAPY